MYPLCANYPSFIINVAHGPCFTLYFDNGHAIHVVGGGFAVRNAGMVPDNAFCSLDIDEGARGMESRIE